MALMFRKHKWLNNNNTDAYCYWKMFRQIVRIPMGINCAPLIDDFCGLYFFESQVIARLQNYSSD